MHAQRALNPPGASERERLLVRRSWTKAERRVVVGGLVNRLVSAIEPIMCSIVFGTLTAGLVFFPLPPGATQTQGESAVILPPLFAVAASVFLAYAAALPAPALRALLHTFSPLYIVDGYLRYRGPDRQTETDSNGYVAVLNEERRTVSEWPSSGSIPLRDNLRPALIEFSYYGGIHRIDGRSTGVAPESLHGLGVRRG